MDRPRMLVADDTPSKLAAMQETAAAADPQTRIDTATTAKQALAMIERNDYDTGVIDFDFPGEGGLGGEEIVRAMRRKRRGANIICATARQGTSFEEAAEATLGAGANDAMSFMEPDFKTRLTAALAV